MRGEAESEQYKNSGGRPIKGGGRLVQFPMLMESAEIAAVEEAAREEGVSRSEWLRRAARQRLRHKGEDARGRSGEHEGNTERRLFTEGSGGAGGGDHEKR